MVFRQIQTMKNMNVTNVICHNLTAVKFHYTYENNVKDDSKLVSEADLIKDKDPAVKIADNISRISIILSDDNLSIDKKNFTTNANDNSSSCHQGRPFDNCDACKSKVHKALQFCQVLKKAKVMLPFQKQILLCMSTKIY